jgi:hypothetical protein
MWAAQRKDGLYVSTRDRWLRHSQSSGSHTVDKAVIYKRQVDAEGVAGPGGRAVKVTVSVDWKALPEFLPMGCPKP